MTPTISTESLEQLCVVLGTAIPLLVVAFYTALAAIREHDPVRDFGRMPIPKEWADFLQKPFAAKMLLQFAFAYVAKVTRDEAAAPSPTDYELRIRDEFRAGTGRGFVVRSPLGFVLVMAPFALDDSWPRASRVCAAAGLVFTLWSLQALILYSSVEAGLTFEARRRELAQQRAHADAGSELRASSHLAPHGGHKTGRIVKDSEETIMSGLQEELRERWGALENNKPLHGWSIVFTASVLGLFVIVAAVAGFVLVATSVA